VVGDKISRKKDKESNRPSSRGNRFVYYRRGIKGQEIKKGKGVFPKTVKKSEDPVRSKAESISRRTFSVFSSHEGTRAETGRKKKKRKRGGRS